MQKDTCLPLIFIILICRIKKVKKLGNDQNSYGLIPYPALKKNQNGACGGGEGCGGSGKCMYMCVHKA